MFVGTCVSFLALVTLATAAQQQFLGGHQSYNDGLFTPIGDLSVLTDDFMTLAHPSIPRYSVRVKRLNDFCDTTVRSDPDKDDVIFWTNGGPGGSSAIGLFMEHGPCRVDVNNTKFHPESWNSNANMFFVDQPINVGFSYADHGETFQGRPFHMSGESYGGRYLPVFASEVYDQNKKLVEAGLTPINLKSIMIGNGLTEISSMTASHYDVACPGVSVEPILDIATYMRMKQAMLKESCVDIFDAIFCGAAYAFCEHEISMPVDESGKNPYDISEDCKGDDRDSACYSTIGDIVSYLNRPSVREQLGVDPSLNFTYYSRDVGKAFAETLDLLRVTTHYVSALLERGVRVLIYVGKNDWICNHVGNEAWTRALEWSGHNGFSGQPLREWIVDGKPAGITRSAKGLTFATINGAGHFVAYDKPNESLELVNRWLSEVPL